MKQLNVFVAEALIAEAAKWSKSKNINNILIQALGEKSNWSENPRKWLTEIGNTFEDWCQDSDELKWWASDDRYEPGIKETSDDNIYDISYGEKVFEDDKYRDPCTIYTTPSFWGVQFYDNVIVCGKNNKTLNDLSKEVAKAKQQAIEDAKKKEEENEKMHRRIFEEEWKLYVLSDKRDNPKFKHLQKYKGKVCRMKISWSGFDDEYIFIGVITGLYHTYSPEILLPIKNDFKILPDLDYHEYDTPEDFIKLSATYGYLYSGSNKDIIIKEIEEVNKEDREKYFKVIKKEFDKNQGKISWYNMVYNKINNE